MKKPAKRRKEQRNDVLDSLRRPDIDPARRSALQFVMRVRTVTLVEGAALGTTRHPLEHYFTDGGCVNCDKPCDGKIYCSEVCQQEATTVRYVRRVLADGRIDRPDVQKGIGAKLLMLASGGYPAKKRELTPAARAEIFQRDKSICQLCGGVATQIDHIRGSSADPSNLRSLCADCNRNRAFELARMITAESDSETFEFVQAQFNRLAARAAAENPVRVCDDEETWKEAFSAIRSARRKPLPKKSLSTNGRKSH